MKHCISCIVLFLFFFCAPFPAAASFTGNPIPMSDVFMKNIWTTKYQLLPIISPSPSLPKKALRIGLQVGHWKTADSPIELADLRKSNGASSGNIREWQVNYIIAQKTAALLRVAGMHVDILPTIIPPNYVADMFVAIHADQNSNRAVHGFKASGAASDETGKANILAHVLERTFIQTTGMDQDLHYTLNMTQYYAFNRQLFKHSINAKTIGVLVENGFLTNPLDQHILINYPEIPARGLANGIINFAQQYY